MATVEIDECKCDKTAPGNFIGLEQIAVLLYCANCRGFHTGLEGDIDHVIERLEKLRDTRVHGRVVVRAS